LNDHLAGSVAGLAILDYVIDKSPDGEQKETLQRVYRDIEEDKEALRAFIDELDFSESPVRKASAWVAEKMAQVKLRFDDPSAGPFLIFESLEALSLGIEGKRSLWRMLSEVFEPGRSIAAFDLETLINRAEEQREIVEKLRLAAGREALAEE
jgi:hypothetical protein